MIADPESQGGNEAYCRGTDVDNATRQDENVNLYKNV